MTSHYVPPPSFSHLVRTMDLNILNIVTFLSAPEVGTQRWHEPFGSADPGRDSEREIILSWIRIGAKSWLWMVAKSGFHQLKAVACPIIIPWFTVVYHVL